MLICVGPVSPACLALAGLMCISVTRGGCLSTQMPRRPSPSCLSVSCWMIQTKQWCGGGPRKPVGLFQLIGEIFANINELTLPVKYGNYHCNILATCFNVFSCFHPTALIGQFVSDVAWGELDVLLVDTPPGTSDEHLAVLENLKKHSSVDGAILVTTPQVPTSLEKHYYSE